MQSTYPEKENLRNENIEKIEDIRIKNVIEINEAVDVNFANNEGAPNGSFKRKLPSWMIVASSNISEDETQSKRAKATTKIGFNGDNSNEAVDSRNSAQEKEIVIKTEQSKNQDVESSVRNDEPVSSNVVADDSNSKGTYIKTEQVEAASTSTIVYQNVDFKPSDKVEKADASSTSRESCRFGIRCYRRNPKHRVEEAHPGDSDYKRPQYPPPPVGVPDCPYGRNCYRRNPTHFQQYKHPDDTDFEQNYRNHRLRHRHQRKEQVNSSNDSDFSDSDIYDLDDPFINDDSDSDYVPSEEEDYTEELDYDDCDKAEE